MISVIEQRGYSHFPSELSGFLKRVGVITATALLAIALVLAASATFDPSMGREPAPGPTSPAAAAEVV